MEPGIAVPGNHIQLPGHFTVIQTIIEHHKIGGHRHGRGNFPKRPDFFLQKIGHIPGSKAFPFQIQSHNAAFSVGKGRLNLGKAAVAVAPEGGPPGLVELFYIMVKFLRKVGLETGGAQRAEALASQLVGDVVH